MLMITTTGMMMMGKSLFLCSPFFNCLVYIRTLAILRCTIEFELQGLCVTCPIAWLLNARCAALLTAWVSPACYIASRCQHLAAQQA
jgi:hypothetical protein